MREETDRLAVLGLKFENRSPIRGAYSLGYRSEQYESVVGGKGAWVVHMIRELLGNAKFSEVLQQYIKSYSESGGTTAGFRSVVEKAYGKEMAWFFGQWLDTTGIPNLSTDYVTYRTNSGFRVMGSIKQDRDMFRLPLDVQVIAQDNKQEQKTVEIDGKTSTFEIETPTLPRQVVLDPGNKVLRDSKEMQIRVQIALGDDLKDRGEYVEAIRAYENALKLNARKSLAHFRLAEVFFDQMNLNSAANTFRDALNGDKDPKWLEVWCYIYLGKINDILGQRQRALAEYNKAVNTKDDTNGAQAEAQKWIQTPYTRDMAAKEVPGIGN
jgi:tetratricopeptide (TPR) repeat protein